MHETCVAALCSERQGHPPLSVRRREREVVGVKVRVSVHRDMWQRYVKVRGVDGKAGVGVCVCDRGLGGRDVCDQGGKELRGIAGVYWLISCGSVLVRVRVIYIPRLLIALPLEFEESGQPARSELIGQRVGGRRREQWEEHLLVDLIILVN